MCPVSSAPVNDDQDAEQDGQEGGRAHHASTKGKFNLLNSLLFTRKVAPLLWIQILYIEFRFGS